jgi:predicted HTH domain antitoxin
MQTVTVSLRLPESEVSRLESTAQAMGVDRSTLLRWAVRRGASALLLERACDAYRRGEVTLSRAAEIAGLSVRDMILRLRDQDVVLNYGPEDLAADLQPL